MNIMWFYLDNLGCGSYRVKLPAFALETTKFAYNGLIWQEKMNPADFPELLQGVNVAVFQRTAGEPFLSIMEMCKAYKIPVVYEMDDYLFDIPRHNPAAWFWIRKPVQKALREQLETADKILVSTVPLATAVQEVTGRPMTDIHVCQNHLHEVAFGEDILSQAGVYDNKDKVVIGWQGSTTHDVDFKEAIPALKRILEERENVILRLFGDIPRSVRDSIPIDRVWVTEGVPFNIYPTKLKFCNFDIGIAPVSDSKFNSCKSNIKWLEYSACRFPTVASDVYPYRSIEHGVTGFLARTENDWYEHLNTLIEDVDLRVRMGNQAYEHVWSTWSSIQRIESWKKAFSQLIAKE
jgi:glycosyltransferase involved in cell wall biosynthesis